MQKLFFFFKSLGLLTVVMYVLVMLLAVGLVDELTITLLMLWKQFVVAFLLALFGAVLSTILLAAFVQGEEKVAWPDLSTIKYVSQRSATEADVKEGAAVFLFQSEGVNIGSPMSLNIPQYAIHTDGKTGGKSNVVIIQAEEANGQQVIGALIVGSSELMSGLANEFKLLGKSVPNL